MELDELAKDKAIFWPGMAKTPEFKELKNEFQAAITNAKHCDIKAAIRHVLGAGHLRHGLVSAAPDNDQLSNFRHDLDHILNLDLVDEVAMALEKQCGCSKG